MFGAKLPRLKVFILNVIGTRFPGWSAVLLSFSNDRVINDFMDQRITYRLANDSWCHMDGRMYIV